MQVVTSDHNRPLHFHLSDNPFQDPASNAHVASERALLVDVRAIDRLSEIRTELVRTDVQPDCGVKDSPLSVF